MDKNNDTNDVDLNTFSADYDEQIDTVGGDNPQTVAPEQKEKKKSSDNKKIYYIGGVLAVGVVGYMFAKPFLFPEQAIQQPVSAPVVQQPVVPTQQPQVAPPVQQVTPPVSAPVDSAATNFLTGQSGNPLAGNRAVQNASEGVQAPVVQPTIPPVQQVVPQTQPPVVNVNVPSAPVNGSTITVAQVPVSPVDLNSTTKSVVESQAGSGNNIVQKALVEELKGMFEQQTKEIKGSIDAVGDRVTVVEKAITKQEEINKSLDERLAKLEAGKTTKEEVAKVESKPKAAPAPAKKTYQAPVRKAKPESSDVLVDKSVAKAPVAVPARTSAPNNIQIHSVFAGRVWIKNPDSSLSTYVAGERLPTGEVIQRVDDASGQIITNRRTIK